LRDAITRLPDRSTFIEALEPANRDRQIARYRQYLHGQVTELLSNYGKIDVIWFDFSYPGNGGKGKEDWNSPELVKLVRGLQPIFLRKLTS
jgi:alpha-L-fucosidase